RHGSGERDAAFLGGAGSRHQIPVRHRKRLTDRMAAERLLQHRQENVMQVESEKRQRRHQLEERRERARRPAARRGHDMGKPQGRQEYQRLDQRTTSAAFSIIRIVKCTASCRIQLRQTSITAPTAMSRGTKLSVCSCTLVIVCRILTMRPTTKLTTSAGIEIIS